MMRRVEPPRLARRLLALLLRSQTKDEVLADLEEIWAERCASEGRAGADRWFWGQLFRSVRPAMREDDNGRGGGMGRMSVFKTDVAFGLRQLGRHPGVGSVVVLTLALGIGATTAIFSAVYGVLLEPLPYDEPAELVMVTSEAGGSTAPRFISGPDVLDMAEAVPSLEVWAGLLEPTVGPMTQVDRPEHILTVPVTWNLFGMLGVDVALGRNLNPDDAVPLPQGTTDPPPRSALISHDFWNRSFGGDPNVIGKVVHIWGGATEIVGVMPEGFQLVLPPELNIPPDGDVWRVLRWDMSRSSRERRALRTVARMAPGVSLRRVRTELESFAGTLRVTHPHHAAESTEFRATGLEASVAAPMKTPLWLLMGAVSLVLLIACANVTNLLLARGAERADEMAVRSSLGAGGARLVRQLLAESSVLAVLGAVLGVLLARVGVALLHAIRPADLHRLEAVQLDLPVLGFTVVAAVAATLIASLLPAYFTAKSGPAAHLRTRGVSGVAKRSRTVLVVAEVALSVVLLVGAGLLIRTFGELQRMPLGFEPEQVLTITATQSSRPREERQAYEADIVRAAASVPGVSSAGIVFPLPMNGVYDRSAEYAMDGREADPSSWTAAYFRTISPTYFEAMGLQLKRGRGFQEVDENYDVPIVILDERLAEIEFPGENPVGRPLWVRGMEGDTLRAEIVGVVEYAPQWDHRDLKPTMYFPRIFYQSHEVSVVAKVEGDPTAVAEALGQAIRGVDPAFPSDLVPMEDYVRERLARSRFLLILMQVFSVLALTLTAVGLYGVLAYSVRQRTQELGLRLALGAEAGALTGRVVLSGLQLAGVGIGIGLLGALALGQTIRSQLVGVGAADPMAFAGTVALVLLVSVVASLLPALRAARVDPVVALQQE
jgi:putative ABC transport system permease protein